MYYKLQPCRGGEGTETYGGLAFLPEGVAKLLDVVYDMKAEKRPWKTFSSTVMHVVCTSVFSATNICILQQCKMDYDFHVHVHVVTCMFCLPNLLKLGYNEQCY